MNKRVTPFLRHSLLLTLTLLCCYGWSAPNDIRFARIAQQQQLSQATVKALWQDDQGFMWIGSQDGLNRYDGYGVKVYRHDPDDPYSLSSNWINALYQDDQGILWVATAGGLNRYDKKTDQFSHIPFFFNDPDNPGHDIINTLFEDDQHIIWIGTRAGLNRYDSQTGVFSRFVHDPADIDSISDNDITAITQDRQGQLWIGTSKGGVNRFDRNRGTFSRIHADSQRLNDSAIFSLLADRDGSLWIGSYERGLFNYNSQTDVLEHFENDINNSQSLSDNWVHSLLQDSEGVLWVGTGEGLNRYEPDKKQFLRLLHDAAVPGSLLGHRVTQLYEDNTGVIWVGTTVGLSLYNRQTTRFSHYRHIARDPNSLSDNSVLSIIEDNSGVIWVATDGGLNRFDRANNRVSNYDYVPILNRGRGVSVYESRSHRSGKNGESGEIWVGTFSEGLIRINDQTGQIQQFKHDKTIPTSLTPGRVNVVMEDKHQNLWVGTNNGLNRFDRINQTFRHYKYDSSNINSISSNEVITLYSDSSGALWVGTRFGGLNRFHPRTDSFTRFVHRGDDPGSISHNRVFGLAEDLDDNLWIATKRGLNRFVPGQNRFIRFGEKQGLINNTVYGVLPDNQGNLWLSSNKGISRFNIKTSSFRHFDVYDGLQGNEYTSGAAFKSADGEMFFGGINGFNTFYPDQVSEKGRIPKTVITDFLLFNQSVPLQRLDPSSPLHQPIEQTTELTLSHTDSVFAFEFAAIDFANPQGNRYAYRLLGYDSQWMYTDADHRRATYTSLPAGTYQFKVKGANKNGLFSDNARQIEVTILPAPWQTWWAYGFYMMAIICLIGLARYQRREKLHERELHHLETEKNQEQLQLALWGSGDQLWDIDLVTNKIKRKNLSPNIDYPDTDDWQLPGEDDGFTHPDDTMHIQSQVTAHLERETEYCEITYRVRNKSGEWIWLLDRGQVVEWDRKGHPLRFSGTTKNIDHLKSTEAELLALTQSLEQRVTSRTQELSQRTKELIQSNEYLKSTQSKLVEAEKLASLGGLVAGISHEINTPVGIAITALSALKERVRRLFDLAGQGKMTRSDFANFNSQSDESLTIALQSLYKASELVESFKQIAVDRANERRCEVKMAQLIDDVIAASLLNTTGVDRDHILVSCPPDLSLMTYPDAFAKVFYQLVQNTLVHGYHPGEQADIEVKVSREGDDVLIRYQDKGKGMDQQTREHIFDPFYTTNRIGGTGLGMHVAYNQITQLLKGQISCESVPGQGCRFVMSLPCQRVD